MSDLSKQAREVVRQHRKANEWNFGSSTDSPEDTLLLAMADEIEGYEARARTLEEILFLERAEKR